MAVMRCFSVLVLVGVLGLLLSSASVDSTTVGVVLLRRVLFGQVFKIVGNTSVLGNWNISKGVNMTWNTGDIWTTSFEVEAGSKVEFKAVVVDYSTGECYCWMPDPNRTFEVSSNNTSVQFVIAKWDANKCDSTCSNDDACSASNVGTCSSSFTTLHNKKNAKPAMFSIV